MKSLKYPVMKVLIALLCLHTVNTASAQHLILDRLTIGQLNGKVYISCVVKAGSTCNGMVLYRGTDTLHFEAIDKILGVCGNVTSPQAYDFIDENPVPNRENFYKLELGGFGFSEIVSIHVIATGEDGFFVFPNPARQKSRIFFEHYFEAETVVNLYNSNGMLVARKKTFDNSVEFETGNLPAGMYYFEIFQDTKYFRKAGKLLVVH